MFMAHDIKSNVLANDSALTVCDDELLVWLHVHNVFHFQRVPVDNECTVGVAWPHRASKNISCDDVRKMLNDKERDVQQNYVSKDAVRATFLLTNDVGACWPNCPDE
jgi:hypothetical protein